MLPEIRKEDAGNVGLERIDYGRGKRKQSPDGHDSNLSVILPLLVGFSGIIGLLTTAILRIPLLFTLVFIALAAVGLPCGFSRLGQKGRKVKPVVIAAIASIFLSPFYVPVGIAIGFFTPQVPSKRYSCFSYQM